jgi:hypothetical protein
VEHSDEVIAMDEMEAKFMSANMKLPIGTRWEQIKELQEENNALRADLARVTGERDEARVELSAWHSAFGIQQLTHAVAQRDEAHSLLASICDVVNTWSREENFRECRKYIDYALRDHICDLQGHVNQKKIKCMEDRDFEKEQARIFDDAAHLLLKEKQDVLADLAAARAVLREVEWAGMYILARDPYNVCVSCNRRQEAGHRPDCKLAAALGEGKA